MPEGLYQQTTLDKMTGKSETQTFSLPNSSHSVSSPKTSRRRKPPSMLFAFGTSRAASEVRVVPMSPGLWVYDDMYSHVETTMPFPPSLTPSVWFPTVDTDSLQNRLLADIKSQKINLSVSVAELGKSTDMVFNLAREVYGAYRDLRRSPTQTLSQLSRAMKRDSKSGKQLANRWLEYTYGWTPLINDISGLSEEIGRSIEEGRYVRVRASKTESYRGRVVAGNIRHDHESWERVAMTAYYRVSNSGVKRASALGLTNPLAMGWELVPYSFVFDWLIPVGDYLNALDALVGIDSIYVQSVTKREGSAVSQIISSGAVGASAKRTERSYSRSEVSTSLQAVPPSFSPSVGARRMLNGLALLRQHK